MGADLTKGSENTYSSASCKSFNNAALLVSLKNLINCVLPLNNLELFRKSLPGELDAAAASDTIQDQPIIQGRCNQLKLAGILRAPQDEEIASTRLGALSIGSIQPEDLAKASRASLVRGEQARAVVGANLGIAETTHPGTDLVLWAGMELHTAHRGVHTRHEAGGDEQEGLLGSLDTELRLGTNHGGAEVEEGARTGLGKPLRAIDLNELGDELSELLGTETWQGDPEGGHEHAVGIEVRAEQTEFAVKATEALEALEAFGRVVEDRGGGHE